MIDQIYFDINSNLITYDISSMLLSYFGTEKPIVVCVGCDKVLSDMVGVLVGDILKKRNVQTIVFGGSKRNVNKSVCKFLSTYIDVSRLLFVDSGALCDDNKILLSPFLLTNDGSKISSLSLVAGTIKRTENKYLLATKSYSSIKKYAGIIADAICEYFSYVDLLCSKNAA